MSYEVSDHLHYKVLHLTGEVDLDNSPALRQMVLDILRDEHSLLADFSKLTYIDSSGVATFVEALNLARSKGLSFSIVGAADVPLQVLQLSRLDGVFDLKDTLEDVRM